MGKGLNVLMLLIVQLFRYRMYGILQHLPASPAQHKAHAEWATVEAVVPKGLKARQSIPLEQSGPDTLYAVSIISIITKKLDALQAAGHSRFKAGSYATHKS